MRVQLGSLRHSGDYLDLIFRVEIEVEVVVFCLLNLYHFLFLELPDHSQKIVHQKTILVFELSYIPQQRKYFRVHFLINLFEGKTSQCYFLFLESQLFHHLVLACQLLLQIADPF